MLAAPFTLLPQKQVRGRVSALGFSCLPGPEPKEPPEGLGCPLLAGVLGSGWPATGFNNSNSEHKRSHPSCLWVEEERKKEGEEGEEGAG